MCYKDLEFTCQQCGAKELSYQKYAKCITPVSLRKEGHMEYGQSTFDEDDYLATLNGFACRSCGTIIEHCGCRLETEKQLRNYLAIEPYDRLHQQQEYEELLDIQMYAQEQQEKEQELYNKEIADISENNG